MSTPANATTVRDDVAAALKNQVWKQQFQRHASTKDVFSALEGGRGDGACIVTDRDLVAKQGEQINFSTIEELGERPRRGEEQLVGQEEILQTGSFNCIIDYVRHATALTEKIKKVLAAGRSIESVAAELLGNHFGREAKQADMLHRLIRQAVATNTMYGDDKASIEALKSADVMSTAIVNGAAGRLSLNGAPPVEAMMNGRVNRKGIAEMQTVDSYFFVIDDGALRPMRQSLNWLQDAGERGANNPLFNGKWFDYDGNKIGRFVSVDNAKDGPIGSPLTPRAWLGEALSAASGATPTIKGGGSNNNARPLYFRDFPGYDYLFSENQAAAPDANDYYLLLYSPANNHFNVVKYTGSDNDGNEIVATEWISGANTAVDNVDSTGAPWLGNTGDDFEVGSLILPCNSYGVPYGYSLALGADAACRAYGEDMKMIDEREDYGWITGIGYQAMYGQEINQDSLSVPRHYVLVAHALTHVGVPFPTVT